jgi:transcriptional regulator with XRE-family HTH domain
MAVPARADFSYYSRMITREQLRAARGLLGWKQIDLAEAAGITLSQIKNIERGAMDPRASMLATIEAAFNQAGVVFIDQNDALPGGRGVRFRE